MARLSEILVERIRGIAEGNLPNTEKIRRIKSIEVGISYMRGAEAVTSVEYSKITVEARDYLYLLNKKEEK